MSRAAGPLSALRRARHRSASPGGVVLGYHDVTGPNGRSEGLSVSATDLTSQLRLIERLGFSFVSLADMVERLRDGRSVDALAAVTFDDALLGVHHHATEVLDRFGVSSTVFVVTDHLGVSPPWWAGMPRTMNESELAELVDAGHDLGSHTCSHRSLPSLDDGDLVDELTRSRAQVASLTDRPLDLLAYPSGHHDDAVRSVARQAGYRAAVTFLNGRVDGTVDPFRVPRLTMGAHLSPARLGYQLLRGASTWPDHQLASVTAAAAQRRPGGT